MERNFRIAMSLIFPDLLLVPHMSALFLTSLSTVPHFKSLLWHNLQLVLIILLKNKYPKREEDIPGLLEVTITEIYLM